MPKAPTRWERKPRPPIQRFLLMTVTGTCAEWVESTGPDHAAYMFSARQKATLYEVYLSKDLGSSWEHWARQPGRTRWRCMGPICLVAAQAEMGGGSAQVGASAANGVDPAVMATPALLR